MALEVIITGLYILRVLLYSHLLRQRMQVTVLLSACPLAILCPEVAADFPAPSALCLTVAAFQYLAVLF